MGRRPRHVSRQRLLLHDGRREEPDFHPERQQRGGERGPPGGQLADAESHRRPIPPAPGGQDIHGVPEQVTTVSKARKMAAAEMSKSTV